MCCGIAGAVVVILFSFSFGVNCDLLPECDGVEGQTFIAAPVDCQSYFYCDGDESFAAMCPDDQRFNSEMGICDDPANVECASESEGTSTTLETTTTTETTKIVTSTTVTSPSTPSSTASTANTKSSTSSTQTSTEITTSTQSPNTGSIICPATSNPKEITYLPNSQSCSEYFVCFSDTPISMVCPKDLQFNALTSSCDWESVVKCKIIGTTTPSPRELCSGHASGYFEYSGNCHYYYRCLNGLLTIQECPPGFGWDAEKKVCSSMVCRSKSFL